MLEARVSPADDAGIFGGQRQLLVIGPAARLEQPREEALAPVVARGERPPDDVLERFDVLAPPRLVPTTGTAGRGQHRIARYSPGGHRVLPRSGDALEVEAT